MRVGVTGFDGLDVSSLAFVRAAAARGDFLSGVDSVRSKHLLRQLQNQEKKLIFLLFAFKTGDALFLSVSAPLKSALLGGVFSVKVTLFRDRPLLLTKKKTINMSEIG